MLPTNVYGLRIVGGVCDICFKQIEEGHHICPECEADEAALSIKLEGQAPRSFGQPIL